MGAEGAQRPGLCERSERPAIGLGGLDDCEAREAEGAKRPGLSRPEGARPAIGPGGLDDCEAREAERASSWARGRSLRGY